MQNRRAAGRFTTRTPFYPAQAAKNAGTEYDPRGVGSSWNHSFLVRDSCSALLLARPKSPPLARWQSPLGCFAGHQSCCSC
jgi:hypothetical protein